MSSSRDLSGATSRGDRRRLLVGGQAPQLKAGQPGVDHLTLGHSEPGVGPLNGTERNWQTCKTHPRNRMLLPAGLILLSSSKSPPEWWVKGKQPHALTMITPLKPSK